MTDKNQTPDSLISSEIEKIIEDGQRLIYYIIKHGDIHLDQKVTEVIVNAKYKVANNQWSVEDESTFLENYDKLAKIIYPVTIESLNAIIPTIKNNKRQTTKAERSVAWYRKYTIFALILLLAAQAYWLFGHEIRGNLIEIIEEREIIHKKISELDNDEKNRENLLRQLELHNQKFDASNKLLKTWNQVWLFGKEFKSETPRYFQKVYNDKRELFNQDEVKNAQNLRELNQAQTLHEERIVLYANILSSDFILKTFQSYFLPLLYGLLGAFIFVLRTLMNEVKAMTYTLNSEIKFRLRLTLGALGGMIIGWFLKPEEGDAIASLSPMALAFLMGYNVDVLFSIMDRIMENISSSFPATPPNKKANIQNTITSKN